MIVLSLIIAAFNATVGVRLAYKMDLSYAGVIAVVTGIVAMIAFLFSPRKGHLRAWFNRRKRQHALKERLKKLEDKRTFMSLPLIAGKALSCKFLPLKNDS